MSSAAFERLKSGIGRASAERRVILSGKEMRDFAACVKATVGATSHSPISSSAIPTVFTIFREGEFELLNSLGIELKQVLHAEPGYSLRAPLSPSEEIRFTTRISSVVAKKGRSANLAFIAFETDFVRTGDGETVATARSTMVYREGVE